MASRSHHCLQAGQDLEQRPVQGHSPPQLRQPWLQTGTQKVLRMRLQRWAWAGQAGMDLREVPLRMWAEGEPRRLT